MQRWYVAGVLAGLEATAAERLKQQGHVTFSPYFHEKLGGGKTVKRRLFPGYIFVSMDLLEDGWSHVNGTRGVSKLLPTHLEQPLPLPLGFVEKLMERCQNGELDPLSADEMARGWKKGESVPIVAGPFTSFSASLSYYKKGSAILLLNLFGRESEISVPLHQIAPAPRFRAGAAAPSL